MVRYLIYSWECPQQVTLTACGGRIRESERHKEEMRHLIRYHHRWSLELKQVYASVV